MIKLLIFDLDGTLAETISSIRDAINMALDTYGFPTHDYKQVCDAIGNGVRQLVRNLLPEDKREDEELVSEVLAKFDEYYDETYKTVRECYPFVKESVYALHERGYILAVLSNKIDVYTKNTVSNLFEDDIFSFVQGQTELPRKPDPTVPFMMMEKFGVRPDECAFIGDSEVDILTARNAGMMSVACAWGCRPKEKLVGADHLIESADELLHIFK